MKTKKMMKKEVTQMLKAKGMPMKLIKNVLAMMEEFDTLCAREDLIAPLKANGEILTGLEIFCLDRDEVGVATEEYLKKVGK